MEFLISDVMANHYDVYRSTVPIEQGDKIVEIERIDRTTSYTFEDPITELDGKTYYYQIVAVGEPTDGYPDGLKSIAAKTQCTVEDWVAPDINSAVQNLSCETPEGRKGALRLSWNSDTIADPSLAGFYVQRGNVRLNFSTPVGVVKNDDGYPYSYIDNGGDLEKGTLGIDSAYDYTITVFDRGGYEPTSPALTCRATDRQPPDQVETLLPSLIGGEAAVKLQWQAPDLEKEQNKDIVSYNVYRCREEIKNVSCIPDSYPEWTKLNSTIVTSPLSLVDNDPELIENERYCYWVRATDDSGNEPELPGTFPTWDAATACLKVTKELDQDPPGAPSNFRIAVEPQGHTLTLKWTGTQVVATASGEIPFADPEHPDPTELTGYQIFIGPAGSVPNPPSDSLKDITDLSSYTSLAGEDQFQFEETVKLDESGELLENGAEYCFRVYSVDASPTKEFLGTDEVCATPADTLPPSAPSLASPTSVLCDGASCELGWMAPTDIDNAPPDRALTFDVYRCDGAASLCESASSFAAISTGVVDPAPADPGYLDEDVAAGAFYTYCIVAVDPSGNPAEGAETEAVIDAAIAAGKCRAGGVGVGPACPSVVQAAGRSIDPDSGLPTDAALCWNESAGPNLAGYNIYACTTDKPDAIGACELMNFSLIEQAAPGAYCISPVATEAEERPGGHYYYTVLAVDGDGLSCPIQSAAFDGPIGFSGYYCEGGVALRGEVLISDADYGDPSKIRDTFPAAQGLGIKACLNGRNVLMEYADSILRSSNFDLCLLPCVAQGDCTAEGASDPDCPQSDDLEIYISGLENSTEFAADSNGLSKISSINSFGLSDLEVDADPIDLDAKYKLLKPENAGDATRDGAINIDDFLMLRSNFFVSGCDSKSGPEAACEGADFNRDGQVNIDDYLILRDHFFYQCKNCAQ